MELPSSEALRERYRTLVPAAFFQELERECQCSERGIYVPQVVIWLMLRQQLFGHGTLAEAVQQVVLGQPGSLLPKHKRVREGTVSSRTGAYSQARKRLPVALLERVAQRIVEETGKPPQDAARAAGVYLMDGSGLVLPHTPELAREFPPATNQHGVSHWPVMRIVVAHHLVSGAAVQPCWGPMFGKKAVSEQSLSEQLFQRLPRQSTVVADRNFGVFSVAFAAHGQGHCVVVRMTKARAQRVMGGSLPKRKTDSPVEWKPSRDDRRAHPTIPPDACLRGRLIIRHLKRHGQMMVLYLFTTAQLPANEIVELYGRRWNIETDLRSLKQMVRWGQVRSLSTQMVTKELISGVMAYNLVRTVQLSAAQLAGIDPRQLSFSKVQTVVNVWFPALMDARSPEQFSSLFARMLTAAAQAKLPKQHRRRPYPRAIWGRPQEWPRRTVGNKPRHVTGGK